MPRAHLERNLAVVVAARTKTEREVAQEFGISPGRVHQIVAAHREGALAKAEGRTPDLALIDSMISRVSEAVRQDELLLAELGHLRRVLSAGQE